MALTRRGLLAGVAALAGAPRPVLARPYDDVIKTGTISFAVYAENQPWSWREGAEPKGIDVEIGLGIAEGLGVTPSFLVRQAGEKVDDDLRVNVWRGDIVERIVADVMLHVPYDRVLETNAEARAVLFNPYFGEEIAVVYDTAVLPEVSTFARFVYKPIAVEVDTVSDFFLSNAFGGRLHPSIRRGRILVEAVQLFIDGEAPAFMGTRAQCEWAAKLAGSRTTALPQPPMPGILRPSWPIAMAVKEDSRDLGYAIGDIVEAMRAQGKLDEICARHGVTYRMPDLA